jgi:Ser/Thr protein kinase RdoA (MazF antagonist)
MVSAGWTSVRLVSDSWHLLADVTPTTSPRVTKLQTPSGCLYLKAAESTESVERHLDLLEYLSSTELPVPRYLATTAGQRYVVDEGKAFWLSRELPGHHLDQFRGPAGVEQVERLATALGELHRVLVNTPTPQPFPVFREAAEDVLSTLLVGPTPFDSDRLQRLRGKVASVASLPKQLIHRDFHRGNVLFTGESLSGYLDFDLVHQGPRLFDICYCASGVLSESFREPGYAGYWLRILEAIFRAYSRIVALSTQERSLAWSMLMLIELIFMRGCLDNRALDAALMNQDMLFWFEEHRSEIEAAVA